MVLAALVRACLAVAIVGLIVDASGFERLVRDHVPGWIAAARRVTGSDSDSEDVVFRVLEKLWVAVQREGLAIENIAAYGTRAVQNEARDLLRSRKRAPAPAGDAAGGADPLDEVLAREGRALMDRTLATLESEDRRVVELRAFEQQSYDQIARAFRDGDGAPRSAEWAKKRFQRALARLHAAASRLFGGGSDRGS